MRQSSVSMLFPAHVLLRLSLLHTRVRTRLPNPQVLEHGLQLSQSDQNAHI